MELLLQLPHAPSWPEQGQELQQDSVNWACVRRKQSSGDKSAQVRRYLILDTLTFQEYLSFYMINYF